MDSNFQMKKRPAPDCMVIYNPMSAACVLAAAMIASATPDVVTVKITDKLPYSEDFEGGLANTRIYWIGVDPFKIERVLKTEKTYYIPDDGSRVLYRDNKNKEYYPSPEEAETYFPTGEFTITTLEKLRFLPKNEFPINESWYGILGPMVHEFQNPKIREAAEKNEPLTPEKIKKSLREIHEDMLLVYYNVGQAQSYLDCEERWQFEPRVPAGFSDQYDMDVKIVKKRLDKNLRRQQVTNGKDVFICAATSFHDFLVHMALRMVRMTDAAFVNFTHSTTNPVVYTNVRNLVLDSPEYKTIRLEF